MELSEEEKKKFMSLIDKDIMYYNGKRFIRNLSNVVYVEIQFEEDHIKYFKFAYANDDSFYPMSLSCNKSNLDFIISIIDKISPKMRIIYSSDVCIAYSSERFDNKNIWFSVAECSKHKAWISLLRHSYLLYDYNAIVCDDVLEQLCADEDKKHDFLKEYVSHPEAFSEKMRGKIKPLYDELSASEKLLLELGCDI